MPCKLYNHMLELNVKGHRSLIVQVVVVHVPLYTRFLSTYRY